MQANVKSEFPLFGFNQHAAETDFDFNMLSEYLLDEEPVPTKHANTSRQQSKSSVDMSDEEDLSSGDDDQDNKKRKISDNKKKSQDQIDRRRERNRVLARKTRLRKKFFFESLQKQVAQLAVENDMLKDVVRQRMRADLKEKILAECNAELPPIVANATSCATSVLEKADFNLMQAIQQAQRSFVITDPSLPDNPIIFASKGFLDMCGYQLEEVLGRNCRFLQGPDTDQNQVAIMRKGIEQGTDTSVCILNYKADGTKFYNQVFLAALRDADKKIINYVGVQCQVKVEKGQLPPVGSTLNSVSTTVSPRSGKPRTPRGRKEPNVAAKKNVKKANTTLVNQNLVSGNQDKLLDHQMIDDSWANLDLPFLGNNMF